MKRNRRKWKRKGKRQKEPEEQMLKEKRRKKKIKEKMLKEKRRKHKS